MELNEFKDRVFDILNESNGLPIKDIVLNDSEDTIILNLLDRSKFQIKCESCNK